MTCVSFSKGDILELKGDVSMDITEQANRLNRVGFRRELLDHAVALSGAQRLIYNELYDAVATRGLSPQEALRSVEARQNQNS